LPILLLDRPEDRYRWRVTVTGLVADRYISGEVKEERLSLGIAGVDDLTADRVQALEQI